MLAVFIAATLVAACEPKPPTPKTDFIHERSMS
jgi:hypothetical protein